LLFFLPKGFFFYTGSAFFEAFLAAFCYLAFFFYSSLTKLFFISSILSSITFLAASATFLALISSISLLIRAVSLACLSSSYLKGTDLAYFFSRAFNFFNFLC
jgi:VIT1/CCC1 family predicted Fe2+/Mn2+ transporter